ncbi:MAG: hypothetical protein A4E66_02037 [Syntrophus sp. PtaB.Bin001]|nr:MAG: hypothetical protein A4E66_02037 [Syntrophus sp. PtaB.Bin001]
MDNDTKLKEPLRPFCGFLPRSFPTVILDALKRLILKLKSLIVSIFRVENMSKGFGYASMTVGGVTVALSISVKSVDQYLTVALSYLAIIAGLSGISFSASQGCEVPKEKKMLRYGGERFFHAVLLIVQAIFLRLMLESEEPFMRAHFPSILWLGRGFITICCTVLSLYALYQILRGFKSVNGYLWERVKIRED